ncbi:hypothetical protein HDU76_004295 [Blyttiomyces sp. JEL0837]|nr:hypothetical protein HDU76_004295 [Blyttiomyces sp. JEL0837]
MTTSKLLQARTHATTPGNDNIALAFHAYTQCIESEPTNPIPWTERAMISFRLKREEVALVDLLMAREIVSNELGKAGPSVSTININEHKLSDGMFEYIKSNMLSSVSGSSSKQETQDSSSPSSSSSATPSISAIQTEFATLHETIHAMIPLSFVGLQLFNNAVEALQESLKFVKSETKMNEIQSQLKSVIAASKKFPNSGRVKSTGRFLWDSWDLRRVKGSEVFDESMERIKEASMRKLVLKRVGEGDDDGGKQQQQQQVGVFFKESLKPGDNIEDRTWIFNKIVNAVTYPSDFAMAKARNVHPLSLREIRGLVSVDMVVGDGRRPGFDMGVVDVYNIILEILNSNEGEEDTREGANHCKNTNSQTTANNNNNNATSKWNSSMDFWVYMTLIHILTCNVFAMRNPSTNVPWKIYLLPVVDLINHSCRPNSEIQWGDHTSDPVLVVRHDGDLAVKDGDEVTISYIDTQLERKERQDLLVQGWGFRCVCSKCVEEEGDRK